MSRSGDRPCVRFEDCMATQVKPLKQIQTVLKFAAANLDEDVSLRALAARAGLSTFHLHRVFAAAAGETPKQYTLRLRLARAALLLLTDQQSVLNVALACGFQSHEAFGRAFRRRLGMSPGAYRARGFQGGVSGVQAEEHAALVSQTGPCIRLFHSQRSHIDKAMEYSITTKELSPQPVLLARRRVKPSAIAATLGEVLGLVFHHAQRAGAAFAGQPLTRYLEWGPGLWTIEAGMPIAASVPGDGVVSADTLPGGLVATTTHAGPYDKLTEAHAAIQVWIEEHGLVGSGAPWESYVTDPADYPDPADWKTEIFWPVKARP
jgi:AraC family transcriptional regulator